ncbi:class I SAM-dependent methyltransferase [Gandjariella thermophila]|uniref:Methyltransferase n=1 Tax=Gandjariella thermophila TaxID=1931992 RepID=A0A4D4JDZ8_9PSEU|nr:methyltransferase domain-containing protein [Gandjariella thermophila]GDY32868.1 methyltransferase [Gandjariella thermophila]
MTLETTNTQSTPQTSASYRVFISAALRQPVVVGAMAPSSAALAERMTSVVASSGEPVVVELGPGTGSVSAVIQRRLPAGARHIAIEVDEEMAEHLRRVQPGVEVLHGDAEHLDRLLAGCGVDAADAVVSALPWSLFRPETQARIVGQIGGVLAPGGAFTTIAYLHARALAGGRRFHRLLRDRFDEVIVSEVVWRNLPPARVYACRRPVARD